MAEKRRSNGGPLEIGSRQNIRFKDWLSLLEGRGIKKSRRALVSGPKIVAEILDSGLARELLLPPKSGLPAPEVKSYRMSAPLFKELDVLGTNSPLLVVETPEVAEWQPGPPSGLELVVALSDPGNLGALLRSAEAFGARRVILCEECCSPFLPKVTRGASGANLRLPLARAGSLAGLKLQSAYGLHMDGSDIREFNWPRDLFLVLGEEGRGLPHDLNLTKVSIPMGGKTESLNATVAASIALFSYFAHTKN